MLEFIIPVIGVVVLTITAGVIWIMSDGYV